MAQPLPSLSQALNNGLLPRNYPNAHSMYNFVLGVEREVQSRKDLVRVRTIGYLLLYPMSDAALATVVSDIASCNSHANPEQKLRDLGDLYMHGLFNLFKSHKSPYPTPSDHPSRPSFDVQRERYKALLEESPKDYSTAKKQALLRDGFRCMVSGVLEVQFSMYRELVKDSEPRPEDLECCHIFPEALGQWNVKNPAPKVCPPLMVLLEEHHVATAWTLLDRFGYRDLLTELSGPNIHRLDNVMTLSHTVHGLFNRMELWLEEVHGQENRYRIVLAPGYDHRILAFPEEVQFIAHEKVPLPNPKYLRIHAVCCRVAHLSGAVEYIDEILRDVEEIDVLTEDGSSADLLGFMLQRLGVVPPV